MKESCPLSRTSLATPSACTRPEMDDAEALSTRLRAGRYGELQYLRALAAVQRSRPGMERMYSQAVLGVRHLSDDEEASVRAVRPRLVVEELDSLANSRRVSQAGEAFRQRLEATMARMPQALSGARGEALSAQPESSPTIPPVASRSVPSRRRRHARTQAAVPTAAAREEATSEQPSLAQPLQGVREELNDLESRGAVGRSLRDQSFIRRIERVIWARLPQRPDDAAASRLRSSIRQRQARAASLAQPTAESSSPSTTAGGDAGLANLHLVAGASFELLLSIQRTLQQELAAALEHVRLAPRAAADADWMHVSAADAPIPIQDGVPPAAPAVPDGGRRQNYRLGACVVCCEAEVNTVFFKCGHMCACARCAHNLRSRRANCPICRAPVRDIIQAFLAGNDADGP